MRINRFVLVLIASILLTNCGGIKQFPANTVTPTPEITSPPPAPTNNPHFPGLEAIQPGNIQRLEPVASLGIGRIYDVAISPKHSKRRSIRPKKFLSTML